jgi:hypothetical protein
VGIKAINRELKFFDPKLFAVKTDDGFVFIKRRGVYWASLLFDGEWLSYSRPCEFPVLSLTHDWTSEGKPVEWGIEPLLGRLREIDNYNHDVLGRIYEENEKRERVRKQSAHNNFRAAAADSRRDFAKALNDVNTSTLEKIESRRKKDAYRSKRP